MEIMKNATPKGVFDAAPVTQQQYDPKAELAVDVDISLCTEEERPRMISIVNRLAKSEAGRETLEIAAKAGYKFGFLDASTNCFGCCFGGIKCIGLGPMASDDKLVSTLCHESRHAGQGVRMELIPDRDQLNVASIIRASRAKEADAQAYALKACKELEMQGDAGPLATFAKFYPPIYAAYEKALAEQNGVMNDKVVAGVFKGWYDQTGTKQSYEEGYIIEPMHDAIEQFNKGTTEDTYTFEHNVSSSQVVQAIGWTKNGNYLADEDPKFLDGEHYLSIGERTKKDAQDFFDIREEKTGIKKDKTVAKMPTHKDAYARRLPEMGKPRENTEETMSMGQTIEKWNTILGKKLYEGR
ncbi:MAG: hypothetical protein J5787_01000 [Alphaproteobacteria bacterium]|nr:hypothetical protein [Alphaproteobacteria bacterium]